MVVTGYNVGAAEMNGTSVGGTLACSAASTLRNLANIAFTSQFLSIPSNTSIAISYSFVTPKTDPVTGCCTEVTSPTYLLTYDDLVFALQNPISGTGTALDPYIITAFTSYEDFASVSAANVDNLIQTL
jgi:hypothetical protein